MLTLLVLFFAGIFFFYILRFLNNDIVCFADETDWLYSCPCALISIIFFLITFGIYQQPSTISFEQQIWLLFSVISLLIVVGWNLYSGIVQNQHLGAFDRFIAVIIRTFLSFVFSITVLIGLGLLLATLFRKDDNENIISKLFTASIYGIVIAVTYQISTKFINGFAVNKKLKDIRDLAYTPGKSTLK